MHGFFGCIEADDRAAQAMTDWMQRWIEIPPRKETSRVEEDRFRCLVSREQDSAPAPVASEDGDIVLTYDGFVATDQLRTADGGEPGNPAEVAAALLRRYRAGGPESLAGLNGRYVAVIWRPEDGTLELCNDGLGLRPVFLWHKGSSFAFSTNVWAIACHPAFERSLDPRGIVDLLLLSHQQANRTLFKEVSVLPPGSITRFEGGELSVRPVRTLEFSRERWEWSIERAAEEMYALLRQSVRRRVKDGARLTLPLSGGFDSRVLLGLLRERPVEINACTQYQHGLYAEDTRYAKRLARCAGVSHDVRPFLDRHLADYRKRCVAINSGLFDIHTCRYLPWFDDADGALPPVVSAHLGGELTSRFQISDTAFSTPEEQFRIAFGEANRYRFGPDTVREMLGRLVDRELADEAVDENRRFFMSENGTFFHRYFHWDLLLMRRRYICFQLFHFQQFTRVIAPFYDRDFVDFACSLPFAALHKQHAYRTMLRDHFPDLARIPNTNDLPVLTSTREVLRDFAHTQYRRFVRNPLRRLLPLRRWVGHPMEQYGFALQEDSRPVLDHILENRERLAPYLDPDGVRRAIDRQLDGDSSASMGLLGLSALATACEMLDDPHEALRAWQEERQCRT